MNLAILQSFLSRLTLGVTIGISAALSQNLITGHEAAWAVIILAVLQAFQPPVHYSATDINVSNFVRKQ